MESLAYAGSNLCLRPLKFAKEKDIHVGMKLSCLHFPASTEAEVQSSEDGPDKPVACDGHAVPILTQGSLCTYEDSYQGFASYAGANTSRAMHSLDMQHFQAPCYFSY